MTKTLTARFVSLDAARNAFDDLIAIGYPRENVYLEHEMPLVRIITPEATESEAREILGHHDPSEISEHRM